MANMADFFQGGYFDIGAEERFPWDASGRAVWYALFTTAGARGFTSSLTDKQALIDALDAHRAEGKTPMLIGVWTGQYYTSLFPLDGIVAAGKLRDFLAQHEAAKIARAEAAAAQKERDRILREEAKAAQKRAEARIAESEKTKRAEAKQAPKPLFPAKPTREEMARALLAPSSLPRTPTDSTGGPS